MRPNGKFLRLPGSPNRTSRAGSLRPKVPEHGNNLYASYYGLYSKTYAPSYDGTFKSRSTAAGTLTAGATTREPDNQKGTDPGFDEVHANIHSPAKFEKYRKREIFHRRDGCMHGFAHEGRFVKFNDTTIVNTKYLKYQSPHFKKWADHSLDEYIKNPSNCAEENATH